jgi:putative membrane protein
MRWQVRAMDRRLNWFVLALAPILVWSAVAPHDYFTWFLEIVPILIGLPVAFAVQRQFRLSGLLLGLLWLHCVILIVGGHYTYARVPLGNWVMAWCDGTRNNYDKLGHFAQGFISAILVREILIRTSPLKGSKWLGFLTGSVCLAFSALYELFEWLTAVASGAAADDFLGTQGDVWDTQTDMAAALIGAVVALLLLTRWHDRSMAKIRRG